MVVRVHARSCRMHQRSFLDFHVGDRYTIPSDAWTAADPSVSGVNCCQGTQCPGSQSTGMRLWPGRQPGRSSRGRSLDIGWVASPPASRSTSTRARSAVRQLTSGTWDKYFITRSQTINHSGNHRLTRHPQENERCGADVSADMTAVTKPGDIEDPGMPVVLGGVTLRFGSPLLPRHLSCSVCFA